MLIRVIVAALMAAGCCSAASAQQAKDYPNKPIRMIVGFSAGGIADLGARLLGDHITRETGQAVVVENPGAAAGTVAALAVAKAPPDGYTLMVHSTTHLGNGTLYRNLPYDVVKDFVGVALLSAQPGVLTVHPSLPAKSVREFIALSKARPGQILYSSSGNGSAPHLSMALFVSMAGIDIVHVPYKGGGPLLMALVANEVHSLFGTLPLLLGPTRSGKVRTLAVTSNQRDPGLPDVPTLAESGMPDFEVVS